MKPASSPWLPKPRVSWRWQEVCRVRREGSVTHQHQELPRASTHTILHPQAPRSLLWLKLGNTHPSQNIYISARQRFMWLWLPKYTGFHGKIKRGLQSFYEKWTSLTKCHLKGKKRQKERKEKRILHLFSLGNPTCISFRTSWWLSAGS